MHDLGQKRRLLDAQQGAVVRDERDPLPDVKNFGVKGRQVGRIGSGSSQRQDLADIAHQLSPVK